MATFVDPRKRLHAFTMRPDMTGFSVVWRTSNANRAYLTLGGDNRVPDDLHRQVYEVGDAGKIVLKSEEKGRLLPERTRTEPESEDWNQHTTCVHSFPMSAGFDQLVLKTAN